MTRIARMLAVVALAVAATLSLGACSGSGANGGPIESRDWQAIRYVDASGTLKDAFVTVPLVARFEGGTVAGAAGCNSYTGSYTLAAEKLTVTGLTASAYRCDAYATEGQTLFLAALPNAATFAVSGSQLTIFDGAGSEILRFKEKV